MDRKRLAMILVLVALGVAILAVSLYLTHHGAGAPTRPNPWLEQPNTSWAVNSS